MWLIVVVFIAAVLYYFVAVRPHKYWSNKGVKQGSPCPILGDAAASFFRKRSFTEQTKDFYDRFPNSRYSGIYQFLDPVLIIRDPELIKRTTVKDFDHFPNHKAFTPEDSTDLWSKNLFALKGSKWREMRSTLSPAFTSSKMKQIFGLMVEVAEQFVKHFDDKTDETINLELKDTFTRFTNDVIASTAFGIKIDSLEDPHNEFYLKGKEATNFNGFWKSMKFLGYFLMPKLFSLLKINMFAKEVNDFFYGIITQNIASREKNGIVRPDMINILMEARNTGFQSDEIQPSQDAGFSTAKESEIDKALPNRKIELTDMDITAQAFIFFFAGFDSVSDMMCFMAHELAVNPDMQERLREEVDDVYQSCNGKVTYEALLGMKYMDMVTSETLRKWPNAIVLDRVCVKPYTIVPETPDEPVLHLKEGDTLWYPVFGIHRDPENFPDPERFDPERFNDENKHNIKPYTYMPFGVGPRNCIGSRFALLENKVLFFCILSNFEIVPVAETSIPLKLSSKHFNMMPEGGFKLGLKRRQK